MLASIALAALPGCDQGTQHNAPLFSTQPDLAVVSANIGPNTPLASNGPIVLQFNRYLLPATISRQSFIIEDLEQNAVQGAIITYDPIGARVTISDPNNAATGTSPETPWLQVGQSYTLALPTPASNDDINAVRAIDGAPLAGGVQNGFFTIGFSVSATVLTNPTPAKMDFCNDVMPIFSAKCGSGSPCHGTASASSAPPEGLELTTPSGIFSTAIGRVSQESNTAGTAGQAIPAGRQFGINYPIIDPGSAATSWLMYKVSLAPYGSTSVVPTTTTCAEPDGTTGGPGYTASGVPEFDPTAAEVSVLSDEVLGNQMPYPIYAPTVANYGNSPLTFEERERVRLWIDQGATVYACGTCQ